MKVVVRALVVAVLVAAATSVGAPSPAQAAASGSVCATPAGRSVVVDFTALGGGVSEGCYTGTSSAASVVVPAVGHALTRDHQGAVCRIDGQPAGCPPQLTSSGYWHLYWSDGRSGWTSASSGDGGLDIACGGSVAWSWDTEASGYDATPKVAAPRFASSGTCGPQPVTQPSSKPTVSRSSAAHATATSSASASTTATASSTASASGSASATPSETSRPAPYMTPRSVPGSAYSSTLQITDTPSHGLAWWVAPAIIALLAAAGGAIWFVRRRP